MRTNIFVTAIFLSSFFSLLTFGQVPSASPNAGLAPLSPAGVIGVWWTKEKASRIEIYKTGDEVAGKIVWAQDDPQKDKLDVKNPDEKLRSRLIYNLELMNGFHQDSDDGKKWVGGKIYDPKSGKTYKAKLELKDENTLELRGFVGISLFGRSETWTRATNL